MKKNIKTIITVFSIALTIGNTNIQTMKVIDITDDVIIVEDTKGNEFEYFGDEVQIGDKVKCLIDTNGTHEVKDDKILFVW